MIFRYISHHSVRIISLWLIHFSSLSNARPEKSQNYLRNLEDEFVRFFGAEGQLIWNEIDPIRRNKRRLADMCDNAHIQAGKGHINLLESRIVHAVLQFRNPLYSDEKEIEVLKCKPTPYYCCTQESTPRSGDEIDPSPKIRRKPTINANISAYRGSSGAGPSSTNQRENNGSKAPPTVVPQTDSNLELAIGLKRTYSEKNILVDVGRILDSCTENQQDEKLQSNNLSIVGQVGSTDNGMFVIDIDPPANSLNIKRGSGNNSKRKIAPEPLDGADESVLESPVNCNKKIIVDRHQRETFDKIHDWKVENERHLEGLDRSNPVDGGGVAGVNKPEIYPNKTTDAHLPESTSKDRKKSFKYHHNWSVSNLTEPPNEESKGVIHLRIVETEFEQTDTTPEPRIWSPINIEEKIDTDQPDKTPEGIAEPEGNIDNLGNTVGIASKAIDFARRDQPQRVTQNKDGSVPQEQGIPNSAEETRGTSYRADEASEEAIDADMEEFYITKGLREDCVFYLVGAELSSDEGTLYYFVTIVNHVCGLIIPP